MPDDQIQPPLGHIQATKAQQQISNINQEMKEKDIQGKAKRLGLPYVNLLRFSVNRDLASFIPREKSIKAKAAVFFKSGKKVRLAILNPDLPATKALITELKLKGYDLTVIICSSESLTSAQQVYTHEEKEAHGEVIENIVEEDAVGTSAVELKTLELLRNKIEKESSDEALNTIQLGAYKTNASDMHFQPQEKDVLVRFRIDGVLKQVFTLTRETYVGLVRQIKFLTRMKLNITNVPQDGQYSFNLNERKINVRVSFMPSQWGETIVMRLLDSQKTFADFQKLGYEGGSLKNMMEALKLPHGMILVTGPTGSGKTTTMYSMLQSIDTESKKVITLEDPVEYELAGITQSQVDPNVDYTFASGLRAILRQDPDIIMVGEIRDLETAETAAQASLTGHLVISTLHTNSAIESISRLTNMGVKGYILAPALDLIVAQRLVRKLCECAEDKPVSEAERVQVQALLESIAKKGVESPDMPATLKHAKGCEKCGNIGYTGQMAIAEVLRFDQGLRDLLLESKPMSEIHQYINEHLKMLSLSEDGILKVIRGDTTLEEVFRVSA